MGNIKNMNKALWGYVIIPILVISVIIFFLNIFIYEREVLFFRNIYEREIADNISLVNRKFENAVIAVDGIRSLFVSSDFVTKEEFDLYAMALTHEIEEESANIPISFEWVDKDNIIRYVYPITNMNSEIVDLNLNEYPNRLIPVIKAKETRRMVVTEPIMLTQGYPGLLLYSPIFKGEEYMGSTLAVIRLSDLFSPIIGSGLIRPEKQYIKADNFILSLDENIIFNDSGKRIANALGDMVSDPASLEYVSYDFLSEGEYIYLADKIWELRFFPAYKAVANLRVVFYVSASVVFILSISGLLIVIYLRRERIIREKARMDALISSIGVGIIVCDEKGIITFINDITEKISGYGKELIGKSYYDAWQVTDDKGKLIPYKERILYHPLTSRKNSMIGIESHLYMVRKDGSRFPMAANISPIMINDEMKGMIIIFRDITKENNVDRMKTEFLSLTSHQLLTPISVTKWISEMLLGGDFGPINKEQEKNIRDIYDANKRMSDLVTSLLNISRIESGRIMVNPKPTHLDRLVEDVIGELRLKIKEKGHSVDTDFEESLPDINIDPSLIREVYKNIISNAVKYTPAKGKISVSVKREGDDIVSEIRDNGYGITEEGKKRVFEKFYRGENIIGIEKDGNGLGLYLVKQIIGVSGGKIWFTSEIGKGTTFYFSLPVSGSTPKPGEVSIS